MVKRTTSRTKGRSTRVPFGVPKQKLNLDEETSRSLKKEGKIPRWIKDVDNRLQEALAGGYEFVYLPEDATIGDAKVTVEEDRRMKKFAGRNKDNSPMYLYLMAIPKKFYDEDQKAKEEQNQMVDDAIRAGQPQGLKPHNVNSNLGSTNVKRVEYNP